MSTTTRGVAAFLQQGDASLFGALSRRILVADDDPAIQRLISRIVRAAGYEVTLVSDGEEAMQAIRTDPPDFLITDWKMPVVDGIALCEFVRRERLPHYVYTILVTAQRNTRDVVRAIAAGADDFLSKPFTPGELLSRLQAGSRILELEQRLTFLAQHDDLTKLLNRRTFFETLPLHWQQSLRDNRPLACVMIDVDRFKSINDGHGHQVGDEVLRAISHTMKECCRESDLVCRYGGEEFCAVLGDSDEQAAVRWADSCRERVAETSTWIGGEGITVTASFGVAERDGDTQTAEQLLYLADQALFSAKRAGRNRVVAFSSLKQSGTSGFGTPLPGELEVD